MGFGDDLLDRVVQAVEEVRERLQRSTAALEADGVPYAVIGGNAVAAWVAMNLTSFRLKEHVHLLDMIGVRLIDSN